MTNGSFFGRAAHFGSSFAWLLRRSGSRSSLPRHPSHERSPIMSLRSWFQRTSNRSKKHGLKANSRARLNIEALEERSLMDATSALSYQFWAEHQKGYEYLAQYANNN